VIEELEEADRQTLSMLSSDPMPVAPATGLMVAYGPTTSSENACPYPGRMSSSVARLRRLRIT
jgi:hypothetical protein